MDATDKKQGLQLDGCHDSPLSVWDVGRPNHLDFLRVVFALMVMLGHSWQYLYNLPYDPPDEPMMRLTHGQGSSGYVAVDAFFAISGFLLIASLFRCRSVGDFLLRRIRRIYPAFVVAAVLFWFIFGFFMDRSSSINIASYLKYLSALHFVELLRQCALLRPVYVVFIQRVDNLPTWTIAYEAVCYLILAGMAAFRILPTRKQSIVKIISLRSRILVLGILICCILWDIFCFINWKKYGIKMPTLKPETPWWPAENSLVPLPILWKGSWPRLLTCFFAGATFQVWKEFIPRRRRIAVICVFALILSVLAQKLYLTLPIFGTYLLFYVAFSRHCKPLHNWLRYVKGDYSYGLYLYAGIVQVILARFLGPHGLSPLGLFGLTIVSTTPFAWASWHYIEKPFLRAKAAKELQPTS